MSETVTGAITPRVNGFHTPHVTPSRADDPRHQTAIATARALVADYLRDVGLRDPDLVAQESKRVVAQAIERMPPGEDISEQTLSTSAIRLTVKRLEGLLSALAIDDSSTAEAFVEGRIVGARLPGLLSRYSLAVKQKLTAAEAVSACRGGAVPVVPKAKPKPMRQQTLALIPAMLRRIRRQAEAVETQQAPAQSSRPIRSRGGSPWSQSRIALAVLTLVSTVIASWIFCTNLAADGVGLIDFPLAVLYAVLFVWVAFSFWTATLGMLAIFRKPPVQEQASPRNSVTVLPPTAILMPVYNEDPTKVFAGLRAMIQSLEQTEHAPAFHFFVLSDSTQPGIWLEEERLWAKLVADLPERVRVFYRHRPKNVSRKAGNIADFCSRWGEHYKYMVVLDADSVMAGDTFVELVRRMEADDEIGILQAPPTPVNRISFFARMQQFAAQMYGPVFLEGFALWSQCDGNYWGHNAIIRVQPFMEHCDLPILPGDGPLGGEILSHDFVEAALMRRAGWKVCLARELTGSYEECPTTILDFAQRDQRWCQGNLQHIRLLLAEGLHPASRLHLGMGAMSYLAAPLWLAFLVLTLAGAFFGGRLFVDSQHTPSGMWLFVVTMAMLLVPKLWGAIASVYQRGKALHVPWHRIAVSMLIETAASMLMAPIMMLLHSQFVAATLMGRKVTWNAQQRDDRGVSLASAAAVHWPHTLIGLAMGWLVFAFLPGLFPWFLPVVLGLVLSIPLAMLLGSVKAGRTLAEARLLAIPEEIDPPPVLRAQREAQERLEAERARLVDRPEPFVALMSDPAYYSLHLGILRANGVEVTMPAATLKEALRVWHNDGPRALRPEVRRAILNDPRALELLHVAARSQVGQPAMA